MTPAGPDTIEHTVCVCVCMFNTISKLCLLSLRLVHQRGALLWWAVLAGGPTVFWPGSCFSFFLKKKESKECDLLLLLLEGMQCRYAGKHHSGSQTQVCKRSRFLGSQRVLFFLIPG